MSQIKRNKKTEKISAQVQCKRLAQLSAWWRATSSCVKCVEEEKTEAPVINADDRSERKSDPKAESDRTQPFFFLQNIKKLDLESGIGRMKGIFRQGFRIKRFFRGQLARRGAALALLIIFVAVNLWRGSLESQGAQYTFSQTDWSGGATANTASHPANENGWNQYSAGTNVVTNVSGQVTLSETNHESLSETFTTTTYKDAVSTTANWNTSGGQIEMASEAAGVNLYDKLNGFMAGATIISQVKAGDEIYIGGSNAKFFKYNTVTDTVTDLSSKFSATPGIQLYSLAYDSTSNVLYIGSEYGRFYRYNPASYSGGGTYPAADTLYTLSGKISTWMSSSHVRSIALDPVNGVVYLGGTNKLVRYNPVGYAGGGTYPTADTAYDLSPKVSSLLANNSLISIKYDSGSGGQIFIFGSYVFGRYLIGTDAGEDLRGNFFSTVGTYDWIYSVAYGNGEVYGGGTNGDLFKYVIASGTSVNLTSKIASIMSTNTVSTLAFDGNSNVLYIGGGTKLIRYNTASYAGGGTYPDADTAYDISSKLSGWNTGYSLTSLSFDPANNLLYVGGGGNLFRYNTTAYVAGGTYPTADTGYNLSAAVTAGCGSSYIYSLSLDSAHNAIYLGGGSGKFCRYNATFNDGSDAAYPAANTAYDLSAKVSAIFGSNNVSALSLDAAHNALYLGGGGGYFVRYNTASYADGGTYPTADTAYDLTNKISGFWATSSINSISFDSSSDAVFLGGGSTRLARYNTTFNNGSDVNYPTANTAYNLNAKISSFWGNSIMSISVDGDNGDLYLGGYYGHFAGYDISNDTASDLMNAVGLSGVFNSLLSTEDAAIDGTGGNIYLAGDSAYFFRYEIGTGTVTNLSAKLPFAGNNILTIVPDLASRVLYLGGGAGKFVRYNLPDYASGGTYPTADTAYDLSAKIASFWTASNSVQSLLFDSASNILYLGGVVGKFARYNTVSFSGGGTYPAADTAYDFTSKINGAEWNGNAINSVASGNNNEVYVGGSNGKLVKYNSQTGIVSDLTSKISGAPISWASNAINTLLFDGANDVLYLGGAGGKFARYNTAAYSGGGTYPAADTAYNLTAKISGAPVSWGPAVITSLSLDAAHNVLYLGGSGGKFVRYNTASWNGSGTCADTGAAYAADTACELVAKISGAPVSWGTDYIYAMAFDAGHDALYIGGWNGKFARYNTSSNNGSEPSYPASDTAYSLTAKISGAPVSWGASTIYSMALDGANGVLYLGGAAGKFGRYNINSWSGTGTCAATGSDYAADSACSLTSKISSFWSTVNVTALTFDSTNGSIYMGGGIKFARYAVVTESAVNLRSPDMLSFWGASSNIQSLSLDNSGKLYIGGGQGYFAEKPAASSVAYAVSSTLDAASWNIAYATLAKNDTPGSGSAAYQLSNDGGSSWESITPGVNHVFSSVGSDLRFKIAVTGNATVQDVSITYWAYNPTGNLVSSKYNATDSTNVLAKLQWTENLSSGTDVKFQLRTSSDGNTWSAWCGPDDGVVGSCNSATYFTDPSGGEALDDLISDQADDQWFQYQATLTSTGINTPVLSDVTATYVVNAVPEVRNVSASQGSDGLVTVNYEVRDPDTTTGVTQNTVAITLQYCTANCSNAGSETWVDAATVTNDGAGIPVQEVAWSSYQLVWNPSADYAGHYNSTDFKIRVKAFDGELANNTGYGSSSTFVFDTSKPTLQNDSVVINDSASAYQSEISLVTLKLQNVAGDVSNETVYVQFSRDGATWYGANSNGTLAAAGNWGTGFTLDNLAALSWSWAMASRTETVTVRIKDGYGNLQTVTDDNEVAYNAYPEIQNITASQGSDGRVTVGYEVRDADTATAVNPGEVAITLEYCTAGCSDPGNETWATATALIGDFGAGVAVEAVDWTSHQIVWTAKSDYDEQYNAADFKVRVIVDDSSEFFNTDEGQSPSFILDTADPTNVSFTIDHTQNRLVLTTPADDSSYQMAVSNIAGNFPSFGAFSSPYTYESLTYDPASVYVRIKDAYGNYADATATTPARPANPIYFDISSANQGTYQEFIAWDVVSGAQTGSGFDSYKVYRKIDDGEYSLLGTVTDRTLNYYLDRIKDSNEATEDSDPTFDPENPSTYRYKIVTTDTNGNVSAFSGEISDIPNGAGGSDSTPPTITDVSVSEITTTSAVVTWKTDELANSSVGYSEDHTYLPERGLSAFETTGHSIALTGLIPGTTYNIRVKSYDVMGNLGAVCYGDDGCSPGFNDPNVFTFSTLEGPAISNVRIKESSNNQATITWETDENSDSHVVYSDTVSNGELVDPLTAGSDTYVDGDYPYIHEVVLSGLEQSTPYYFYVQSENLNGTATLMNVTADPPFFTFLTGNDTSDPVISGVDTIIISNSEVAIYWATDEPANSKVEYKLEGEDYDANTPVTISTYDKSHYVILSGLTSDTAYSFRVTSRDINGNQSVSDDFAFRTLKDPGFQHDPLAAISDISDPPTVLTDTKAVISFSTDQAASCAVEYGTTSGSYEGLPVFESGFNEAHSVHVSGLDPETSYYYRITCEDNLETAIASEEYSFTTLEKQYAEGEIGELVDSVAPVINQVAAKVNSGESVTITWNTDEKANSLVRYGITTENYTDMAGDPLVNNDKLNFATEHSVIINGLVPGIKYYFTVISNDASGNIVESSEDTFVTSTSSSLSSINISSSEMGEALVTWTTDDEISSVVEYGTTNLYGEKKESSTKTTEHSISINGLEVGVLYHLRVKGEDANGQLYSSGDYTFAPKSPPQIGVVTVKDVTEHSAVISFATDAPTDFTVTYSSLGNSGDSGSKGKPDFAVNHEVKIDGLKSGTAYALKIKVSDEQGNSVEKVAQNFTTGKDENAPEVAKTRTESALAQNDKVQTIISWESNELASCRLIYREGSGGEEKEFKVNDRPALSHVAVVTSFKPGTVYYFKIKSADEAGNESVSSEFALLTPQKKENIVQIIINNFQDIFGWIDRV